MRIAKNNFDADLCGISQEISWEIFIELGEVREQGI
jgi:hypothetical protein